MARGRAPCVVSCMHRRALPTLPNADLVGYVRLINIMETIWAIGKRLVNVSMVSQ